MSSKKFFILLFEYDCIQLFTEINGCITKIKFSNGKEKLSNCVTFSYDREDLEFLPDGDPFEVNNNSSFSDFLDFAGYNFDTQNATDAIIESIIENKLITGLGKSDDIFVCIQSFYYEINEKANDEESAIRNLPSDNICGHKIYSYSVSSMFSVIRNALRLHLNDNVLVGYPFLTFVMDSGDGDTYNTVIVPTVERTVVDKVNEKYPLSTRIPKDLLRNIKNRIIYSKLYNLSLPDTAIYQNRKIDIGSAELAKRFDEVIQGLSDMILERLEEINNGPTFIFDYGMHPKIKEAFLSKIKNPVFMSKEENDIYISFLLRSVIIEHQMVNDIKFRASVARCDQQAMKEERVYTISGTKRYFELMFIEGYLAKHKLKSIFTSKEFEALASIKKARSSKE